jgi:hypothetical protein
VKRRNPERVSYEQKQYEVRKEFELDASSLWHPASAFEIQRMVQTLKEQGLDGLAATLSSLETVYIGLQKQTMAEWEAEAESERMRERVREQTKRLLEESVDHGGGKRFKSEADHRRSRIRRNWSNWLSVGA